MTSRKITFALIIVVIVLTSSYLIKTILEPVKTINESKINKEIEGWNYTLDDRDTEIMKTNFTELAEILSKSPIDYEFYASTLAKLYIIDLYTIDNKINASDIPCLEYIEPSIIDNYKLNIMNTLYKFVIDNTNNKRKQELPIVKDIIVDEIIAEKFSLNNQEYDGYKISLSWEYEKELEYDKTAVLNIIKKDSKLFVVKQSS